MDNNASLQNPQFILTDYFFAQDLVSIMEKRIEEADATLRQTLVKSNHLLVPIHPKRNHVRLIYIDIYGNEFIESFSIGG